MPDHTLGLHGFRNIFSSSGGASSGQLYGAEYMAPGYKRVSPAVYQALTLAGWGKPYVVRVRKNTSRRRQLFAKEWLAWWAEYTLGATMKNHRGKVVREYLRRGMPHAQALHTAWNLGSSRPAFLELADQLMGEPP